MFRTVIINSGEYLSVKENWLLIQTDEETQKIPIGDIYSIIIDNQRSSISIPAIHALTDVGVHILICNEKHQPVSVVLPQNTHFHPLSVIRRQIAMTEAFKDALWDRITIAKIKNQALVMKICQCDPDRIKRMMQLSSEVHEGDIGNREGIAAKMFFRSLYGSEFVRMNDDVINAALNYGYTIIRSSFCKTLCAYGYNCVLGIHHINEANPFNLADDLMEPLRPIVDMWVCLHNDELIDELSRNQRSALCSLVNEYALIEKKRMKVRNAIDVFVRSLTSAINQGTVEALLIPEILPFADYNDEESDAE